MARHPTRAGRDTTGATTAKFARGEVSRWQSTPSQADAVSELGFEAQTSGATTPVALTIGRTV